MTNPVTGPFTEDAVSYADPGITGFRPMTFDKHRVWYRQKLPYDQPLPYHYVRREVVATHNKYEGCQQSMKTWEEIDVNVLPSTMGTDANLYNKAYSRFVDKMGDRASLGISVAEGKESMSMITSRLVQLAKFTHALARGRVWEAGQALGVKPSKTILQQMAAYKKQAKIAKSTSNNARYYKPKRLRKIASKFARLPRRETMKGFANLYLEFHFGWSPLVKDIEDSMKALSAPFETKPIKATAKNVIVATYYLAPHDNGVGGWDYTDARKVTRQWIKIGADMRVTNPNLALYNQMGILNPAVMLWNVAHLSFVLDWFLNVGDFLSSFTDFAGVELTNQYYTVFTTVTKSHTYNCIQNRNAPLQKVSTGCSSAHRFAWTDHYDYWGVYMDRITGPFPGPTLKFRDPWTLSPRRGLAAASLLIQRFPKKILEEARPRMAPKKSPFRNGVLPEHFWDNLT